MRLLYRNILNIDLMTHHIYYDLFPQLLFLYFICFINNISERKKTDRKIRQSLKEKNILLKEIHHRVKNNMQVIASLLSLQASFVEDETIRKYFMSSQYRIRSMGMIHEMLYQSENISLIIGLSILNERV